MKKSRIFLTLILILSALCVFLACENNKVDSISSVTLAQEPTKTNYLSLNDSLDLSGGKIEVVLSDGTKHTIEMTDPRVSARFEESETANEADVIVTYRGETVSFKVTVGEILKKASHIEISELPSQSVYYTSSSSIDNKGGTIIVHYEDNSTFNIKMETDGNLTYEYDFSKLGESDVLVSYSYAGETYETSYKITVKNDPMPTLKANIISAESVLIIGDETMFMYLYYEIDALVEELYMDGNVEMTAAYQNNYGSRFKTLGENFDALFDYYIEAKLLDDDDFMDYMHLFLATAYKAAYDTQYRFTEEFKTNVELIEEKLDNLDNHKQTRALASTYGNHHKHFYNLMYYYYSEILTFYELNTYTRLLETSVFYKYVIYNGTEINTFLDCYDKFKERYDNLSVTSQEKFDRLFKDKFADEQENKDYFEGYVETNRDVFKTLSDLYKKLRDDDGLEGGLIAWYAYSDYTFIMMHFPPVQEEVEDILELDDTNPLKIAFKEFIFEGFYLNEIYETYLDLYDEAWGYANKHNFTQLYTFYLKTAENWYNAGGEHNYLALKIAVEVKYNYTNLKEFDESVAEEFLAKANALLKLKETADKNSNTTESERLVGEIKSLFDEYLTANGVNTFHDDIAQIASLYWLLPDEARFYLITLSDITFKSMLSQHYRTTLTTAEYSVFEQFYFSTLHCIQYKYSIAAGRDWYKTEFNKYMKGTITLFENLNAENSPTLLNDDNFKSAYDHYHSIYKSFDVYGFDEAYKLYLDIYKRLARAKTTIGESDVDEKYNYVKLFELNPKVANEYLDITDKAYALREKAKKETDETKITALIEEADAIDLEAAEFLQKAYTDNLTGESINNDLAELARLYWGLSDEARYNFLKYVKEDTALATFESYLDKYYSFLSIQEIAVYKDLYNATIEYNNFKYDTENTEIHKTNFTLAMSSCITKYEALTSTILSEDASLVKAYDALKQVYNGMI